MADPTIFSATLTDDAGVTATAIEYVDFDGALTTVNDLLAAAVAWALLVDGVSDAKVTNVSVVINQSPVSGVKSVPVNDSTVERTGLFTFSQSGSGYLFGMDVPAIANAVVTNGKIDLLATPVSNYLVAILNTAATFPAQSKAGNALLTLKHAVVSFRKRRRARIKASFENT